MNIRDFTIDEFKKIIADMGEQSFRATQIYEWLHKRRILTFDAMTNVSKILKNKICEQYDTSFPTIEKEFCSKIDDTKKYLIRLSDDNIIESVLMKYKYGYTVCVSSEVGCDMGCKFCASTIRGMKRNLLPHEILAQVYLIENKNNIDISNIVVMGSGEPFCNYQNLLKFLTIINSKEGRNLSLRNITISTCGIVPKIREFAKAAMPVTLALSLHAPTDEIRKKIMPIANSYTLDETLDAMAKYYIATRRRITFEYSLIKNVNDSKTCAENLFKLFDRKLKNIDFNINLIPVNEVMETGYSRPDKERIESFKRVLEDNHINVTIRRELGKDISGSCGQLRARTLGEM